MVGIFIISLGSVHGNSLLILEFKSLLSLVESWMGLNGKGLGRSQYFEEVGQLVMILFGDLIAQKRLRIMSD